MKALKKFFITFLGVIQDTRKLSKFSNLFKSKSALEEFIISKNPSNAGDVEHWTRVYNHSHYKGL